MGNSVLSMRRSFIRNGSEHFAAAEGNSGEQSTVIQEDALFTFPASPQAHAPARGTRAAVHNHPNAATP